MADVADVVDVVVVATGGFFAFFFCRSLEEGAAEVGLAPRFLGYGSKHNSPFGHGFEKSGGVLLLLLPPEALPLGPDIEYMSDFKTNKKKQDKKNKQKTKTHPLCVFSPSTHSTLWMRCGGGEEGVWCVLFWLDEKGVEGKEGRDKGRWGEKKVGGKVVLLQKKKG